MDSFIAFISFLSNILQIAVAVIAIYLFIFKRKEISSIYSLLINFAFQTTLSELRSKLDRLNDFNANDPNSKEQIVNILSDILGQIEGNKILNNKCSKILKKINSFILSPQSLTEPMKRSFVSGLRETLRAIDIETYDSFIRR